jgi:hypothetical protein
VLGVQLDVVTHAPAEGARRVADYLHQIPFNATMQKASGPGPGPQGWARREVYPVRPKT